MRETWWWLPLGHPINTANEYTTESAYVTYDYGDTLVNQALALAGFFFQFCFGLS